MPLRSYLPGERQSINLMAVFIGDSIEKLSALDVYRTEMAHFFSLDNFGIVTVGAVEGCSAATGRHMLDAVD